MAFSAHPLRCSDGDLGGGGSSCGEEDDGGGVEGWESVLFHVKTLAPLCDDLSGARCACCAAPPAAAAPL